MKNSRQLLLCISVVVSSLCLSACGSTVQINFIRQADGGCIESWYKVPSEFADSYEEARQYVINNELEPYQDIYVSC